MSHFYQKDRRCRTSDVAYLAFKPRIARWISLLLITASVGCAVKDPPEATVSWLTTRTRAAKAADCPMPLLSAMPGTDYQQIAIIEVAADYTEDTAELERLARREACQTGADALVVTDEQRQKLGGADRADSNPDDKAPGHNEAQHTPEVGEMGHKGSFFNGAAIIYGNAKAQ